MLNITMMAPQQKTTEKENLNLTKVDFQNAIKEIISLKNTMTRENHIKEFAHMFQPLLPNAFAELDVRYLYDLLLGYLTNNINKLDEIFIRSSRISFSFIGKMNIFDEEPTYDSHLPINIKNTVTIIELLDFICSFEFEQKLRLTIIYHDTNLTNSIESAIKYRANSIALKLENLNQTYELSNNNYLQVIITEQDAKYLVNKKQIENLYIVKNN